MNLYKYEQKNGHIEIYYNGEFLCSADDMSEVKKDVEEHKKKLGVLIRG